MQVNWNFRKCGGEARNKKPSVERVWILSGVTHKQKKSRNLGWDHNLLVIATCLFFIMGQADQGSSQFVKFNN